MMKSVITKLFGTKHDRTMKKLRPVVDRVGDFEKRFEGLSDVELAAKTGEFRERLEKGETLDHLLPEAFAVVRHASQRALGMRPYDVQLIGGIILHQGKIAEMKTGEGKTLTATLPLYLNALSGKGAHLVTVNEYLAARDAEWMAKVYNFLGMEVGTVIPQMAESVRKKAYACDITYGTNSEFGFDYLRDNMKFELDRRVQQRGLNFAIVDEVDSVLIDEARTPLIISGQAERATELYYKVNEVVVTLKRDEDYVVDEEHRSVTLTEEGIEKVEKPLELDNLYNPANIEIVHRINKALEAHTLYKRDEKYLVEGGKVVIVDEFTGRKMEGRRWSDGLHQAVEAKEGVQIQKESRTMATITYQNFFRMYSTLSGMTGTADTEAEEFGKIYELDCVVIPTNKPIIRLDQADLVYRTEREKFAAIADQIADCYQKEQPVLVGTVTVDKSQVISDLLKKKNIEHSVLNAKQHGREAHIVAQAGRPGAVTIATNMAGRGTDIVLGGNAKELAKDVNSDETSAEYQAAYEEFSKECSGLREKVLESGGLYILGTERHDSRRVDNQLRGRAGRQGDQGESRFFLSLEDDLMRRFGADRIQGLMQALGMEEGMPIEAGMVSRAIENAQKRVEGYNFDIRKSLLEYDDVMDLQRKAMYDVRVRILKNEDMENLILDCIDNSLNGFLDSFTNAGLRIDDWDLEQLVKVLKEHYGVDKVADDLPLNRTQLETELWRDVKAAYDAKVASFADLAERYNKANKDRDDFNEKSALDIFNDLARNTYLRELDAKYREHLEAMRALRDSVRLQGYAQRDPKHVYKQEGFEMFESMRIEVAASVAKNVLHMVVKNESSVDAARQLGQAPSLMARQAALSGQQQTVAGGNAASRAEEAVRAAREAAANQPRRELPKLGRNDSCWCGSGKKYKQCHLKQDQTAAAS